MPGSSLIWGAKGYEAIWVETPEDVPPWDPSRGFPLEVGANVVHGAVQKKALKDLTGIEELRFLLKYDSRYGRHAATWEPDPAPAECYPRLVRKDVARFANLYNRTQEDVTRDLHSLVKHVLELREGKPIDVLKSKILELNAKYGAPYSPRDNSLEAWLKLAIEVDVHLKAMARLKGSNFPATYDWLKDARKNLGKKRDFDQIGYARATEEVKRNAERVAQPVNPHSYMFKSLNALEEWKFWVLDGLLSVARKAGGSAEAFRNLASANIYGSCRATATMQQGQVIHEAPLYFFVHTKLAEKWRNDANVRLCQWCSEPIPNARKQTKWCRGGSCRNRALRQREVEKASATQL